MPRAKVDPVEEVNAFYAMAGLQAQVLRRNVQTALLMGGVPDSEENISYVSKKMVEKEGTSLLDQVEFLKSKARRISKGGP